jgi:hypothetical protein
MAERNFDGRRQIYPLTEQFALDCAGHEVAGSRAGARREGGRNSSGLPGEPTLWDLTHKRMGTRVASNVAASTEYVVEPLGHQGPVGDRDIGELRRQGRRDANFIVPDVPGVPLLRPRNVGVLTMRGERREFLGSLPYDALWGLIHVFPTYALRIGHLFGILERGRAEIQSVNFARDLEDLESGSEEAHIT